MIWDNRSLAWGGTWSGLCRRGWGCFGVAGSDDVAVEVQVVGQAGAVFSEFAYLAGGVGMGWLLASALAQSWQSFGARRRRCSIRRGRAYLRFSFFSSVTGAGLGVGKGGYRGGALIHPELVEG